MATTTGTSSAVKTDDFWTTYTDRVKENVNKRFAETPSALPEGVEDLDVMNTMQVLTPFKLDHSDNQMLCTTLPMRHSSNGPLSQDPVGLATDGLTECYISGYLKRMIASTPDLGEYPVPRVEVKAHRLTTFPGKGLGMVAERDIRAGELILAERPLLIVHGLIATPRQAQLDHLTKTDNDQVIMHDVESIFALSVERMNPERKKAFENLANSHLHDGSGPILGRVRTNSFAVPEMIDPSGMGQINYGVVCDELSRLNHSCSPNTTHYWDMPSFSMQLRAVRDIEKGQEITTQYCELGVPFVVRQKMLASYNFSCGCESCLYPKTSDSRRFKCANAVARHGYPKDWSRDFELPKVTAVKPLLEIRDLLLQEGLECSSMYGFIVFLLMKTYAARGDVAKTREYAGKYNVWRLAGFGKAANDDELDKAFGLVETAEMVQKMRGRLQPKGKAGKGKGKEKAEA
ncbi:hypothetical protein EIP91_008508 [Steccherinum ochraceum]|uniref:SET domain-containing protein n=1 Tax=Steccherinum ochraceum TaxID=92696 RepID=A0A4R0RGD4_9APHY|nr:hypothetical protein EIP91_008508 [Steccherinum ochraceum]